MASYYNPRITTNGLILYFDAANTKNWTAGILGQGDSQTTFSNTGVTDKRIVLMKGATFAQVSFAGATGVGMGAIQLSVPTVNDSYLDCSEPQNSGFDLDNTSFTISIGFRASSLIANQILLRKGTAYSIIRSSSAQSTFSFTTTGLSEVTTTTNSTITTGQNCVLTCIYNQSTSQKLIYINGLLDKTTSSITGTLSTNNNPLLIGESDVNGGVPITPSNLSWVGQIYFFQIYNRALSAEEVYNNFNAVKGRLRL